MDRRADRVLQPRHAAEACADRGHDPRARDPRHRRAHGGPRSAERARNEDAPRRYRRGRANGVPIHPHAGNRRAALLSRGDRPEGTRRRARHPGGAPHPGHDRGLAGSGVPAADGRPADRDGRRTREASRAGGALSTLLTPRLLAARRQWRGGGLGRPLVLAGVGALFLAAGYRISARILEHFIRVDPDLGRILGVKLMAFLLLVLLHFLLFSALIIAPSPS